MKRYILVTLLVALSTFLFHPQNSSALSDETENCVDRVMGMALKKSSKINFDQYLTQEIKNFCLKINIGVPYSGKTRMAQLTHDMIEDFFSYVILLKNAVSVSSVTLLSTLTTPEKAIENQKLIQKGVIEIGENHLINFKNDLISILRKEDMRSYNFTEGDARKIEDEFEIYMIYSKKVFNAWDNGYACLGAGYEVFSTEQCKCFIGYEWDSNKVQCGLMVTATPSSNTSEKQVLSTPNSIDLSPTVTTTISDQFTVDVEQSQFKDAIIALKNKNVLGGYEDGTFKPFNPINRAEFMKIVVGAAGVSASGKNCFSDIHDEWFASFVCAGMANGIVGGYPDGTFRPDQNINVAEALKITLKAFDITTREAKNGEAWFAPFIEYAKQNNLYLGTFDSDSKQLTREDMAELVYRIMPK